MLAERWGVSPEWVSIISRDPNRDIRFDDALFGLPNLLHLARDLRRREIQVEEATAKHQRAQTSKLQKSPAAGYRYRCYLTIGAIVATTTQFGTVAEEGERGIVFCTRDDGMEEIYGVLFEQGGVSWFGPTLIDTYLATTGLIASDNASYCYVDDQTLQAHFTAGCFNFWPAVTQA